MEAAALLEMPAVEPPAPEAACATDPKDSEQVVVAIVEPTGDPADVGLTPGVASSVAPNGIPVPPTDAPGLLPSGEVIPSEGVVVTAPTWAIAGLQHTKSQATATVKKDFMEESSEMSRASHVRS